MPCDIKFCESFTEVTLYGEATAWDVMDAVQRMHVQDPHKERADLWVVSPTSVIPLSAFTPLIDALKALCKQVSTGKPSAIVSTNALQRAQLSLYLSEASALPYEIRTFESREAAVAWLGRMAQPTRKDT
ncbi:MAG: hypothetical protein K8T26_07370 [Lentisphaerae bacterium]|nr:hypothetical protein [Lentisphaerota bacterium]